MEQGVRVVGGGKVDGGSLTRELKCQGRGTRVNGNRSKRGAAKSNELPAAAFKWKVVGRTNRESTSLDHAYNGEERNKNRASIAL